MSTISINNLPDNHLVNTNRRLDFQNKSFFYRNTHWVEKRAVDDEFYCTLLSHFDRLFHINDLEQSARIWDFLLKTHQISWKRDEDLTGAKLKQIYRAFQESLVYSGPGVECSHRVDDDVDAMWDFLLTKEGSLPSSFFRWENLQRILFVKEEAFLAQFRMALEQALQTGLDSFLSGNVNEEVFKEFVFHIVSLLPYAYPSEEMTTLQIPMKIGEAWRLTPYRVDTKFSLSPSWFSSPLPAFGFLSDVPGAPPLLVCLGTTYPAGDGFTATVLSDFTPGFSVGHVASLYGESEMGEWIETNRGAIATGMSLGGAISLHLSRLHTASLSEVYAFNPPGLYPWNWSGVDHSSVNYHIYSNSNDLVSTMGIFPEGENVHFYRVLMQEDENFLSAHARVYSGAERVTMIRTSPTYENGRIERQILTATHFLFSSLVFFALLPLQLIYRICECVYLQLSKLCPSLDTSENSSSQERSM